MYVHKDGRHIAALVGAAALEGTTECISYVTDISARKEAEEALRASEAQYRALFEQSPFPKFLFDHETLRFLAVNDAAIRHYGYSRDEFLGMTLEDIRPPEDVPGVLASHPGPRRRDRDPGVSAGTGRRTGASSTSRSRSTSSCSTAGRACSPSRWT